MRYAFQPVRRGRGKDFGVVPMSWDLLQALQRCQEGRMDITKAILSLHIDPKLGPRAGSLECFRVVVDGRPVWLRRNPSDTYTFSEVFLRGAYSRALLALPPDAESWLDIGAHIGLFALLLAARYPKASGVVVEPVDESRSVLIHNRDANELAWSVAGSAVAGHNGSAKLYCTEWWSSCTLSWKVRDFRMSDPGRAEHDLVLPPRTVPCVTVEALLDALELEHVDVVKLDVEGAEEELLLDPSWLMRVRSLLLEIHHKYVDSVKIDHILHAAGFHRRSPANAPVQVWRRNEV